MGDSYLSRDDLRDLRYAKSLLEHPSLAARVASAIGVPIERGLALLPEGGKEMVAAATRRSLEAALRLALATMEDGQQRSSNWVHKAMVAATGAAGGALGLPALAVELPVATTIMLRSVADIARSEGELIKSPEGALACLEVFALGGRATSDDATDSGYFAVRAALAKALAEAAEFIAERGIAQEGAPALVRFLVQIAARFEIQVSEKAAAQAIPLIGAAGGALINTLFIDHFQDVARGHFIVRRLERSYDPTLVREEYLKLSSE